MMKAAVPRGSGGQRRDMALELIDSGQAKTSGLITHRFPLDRIKEGFDAQMNPRTSLKAVAAP